jgi:hypothetical protein
MVAPLCVCPLGPAALVDVVAAGFTPHQLLTTLLQQQDIQKHDMSETRYVENMAEQPL